MLALLVLLVPCTYSIRRDSGEDVELEPVVVPGTVTPVHVEPVVPRRILVPLAVHMVEHDLQASEVAVGLLGGDLTTAQMAASLIVHPSSDALLPGGTAYYDSRLVTAASSVATATELEEASLAAGVMVEACGRCHHTVTGAARGAFPPPTEVPDATPQRATWAVARMWEGLVTYDEARWQTAVAVLATVPFHELDAPADVQASAVQAATVAASVTTWDQRGRAFGGVVAACGECHARQGPAFED